jgi:hypothetical protein
MKNKATAVAATVFATTTLFSVEVPAALDPQSASVQLRQTCSDVNGDFNNCFTDLPTLNAWISDVRRPSAANPLVVDIGPGVFQGQFLCDYTPSDPGTYEGYVTFRGAGKGNTVITNITYPISTVACKGLVFRDLTVTASGFAVQGAGSETSWHDVEIRAGGIYAWFDSAANTCYVPTRGKHVWHSSSIISETQSGQGSAYQTSCDESWFFGSEIVGISNAVSGGTATAFKVGEISKKPRAEVHVYGGVIRALAGGSSGATLAPVQVANYGMIHIHGTGIDAIGTAGNPIIALSATTHGEIHANESSYVLKNGTTEDIARIVNNGGHVHAPYMWESHAEPPAITSQDNADVVVVTDASGLPQLVVYNSICPSKWFDLASKTCRP